MQIGLFKKNKSIYHKYNIFNKIKNKNTMNDIHVYIYIIGKKRRNAKENESLSYLIIIFY